MQLARIRKVLSYEGKSLVLSTRGSINVGLFSENHHKISLITGEDLLSNEGVVPFFVDHILRHLVEWIDPQLVIMIGQCGCHSKSVRAYSLHNYYEWPTWYCFILYVAYD
jgi:hypothetical protein